MRIYSNPISSLAARRAPLGSAAFLAALLGCAGSGLAATQTSDQDGATGQSPAVQRITANEDKTKTRKPSGRTQSIVVLVNDEPITGYEIDQRAGMLAARSSQIGDRIKSRAEARWKQMIKDPSLNERFKNLLQEKKVQSREEAQALQKRFIQDLQRNMVAQVRKDEQAKARQGARKQAIDELIDEKLKLQEAKQLNLVADDDSVDKVLTNIAGRNKMDLKQFAQHLKGIGTNISSMRSRFKAMLSWQDVVRRRFGFQVAMLTRDVDRYVDQSLAEGDVELKLHRITIPVAEQGNQGLLAQHLQQADAARSAFSGCDKTQSIAAALPGAKFEDLGTMKSSSIEEPTRSMLLSASDGDMLPPSLLGETGIQLWVVCGRNTVQLETKKRVEEKGETQQEEFDILARKHLKDLRQDATIVYR